MLKRSWKTIRLSERSSGKRLIEAGHTGINDQEAWKIVENEFLKPYENKIYPKDYRDYWDSHYLPIIVGDDDVVSLIMSGTKVPGWW